MVDRNIVNKLGLSQEEINKQVAEMFTEEDEQLLEEVLRSKVDSHLPGSILKGTIVSQLGNDVIVELGLKSEGVVDAAEFDDPEEIKPGTEIEVLLEDLDASGGLIVLSKRKADRIRGWETIINTNKEGDVVTGKVIRRIKGGLLVDIGVPVFLPASQVDIRRPGDITRFIGQEVKCVILKIDVEGRNIVVSRRKLIEEERKHAKEKIMAEIEPGQWRKGIVKNISDFGVFVDLGGVDGLLHISDLSWGRISHPSEVVKLDQAIECVVINVDKENEKISLGLKQKTASPWENVEDRYPVGARAKGTVVNIMNYGAFVRLEEGIEGLVHISEMSWTKRLSHPSEMVHLGDEIEVVVLNVNKEKREISLGLKQTEINPWTIASQKYPSGTVVDTTVRSMTNFGAFVEIEPGIDGMIHISDLSWTKKFNHPSEMLQKGQELKCLILEVNEDKHRISLGIKQLTEDPWIRAIPEKYIPGQIVKGKITKLTNFGAFVELEPDLEGLLHISELADHKIDKPQDVVNLGEEVEVKILRIDSDSRKIGLSLRRARWAAEEQAAETEAEKKEAEAGETTQQSRQATPAGEQAEEAIPASVATEQPQQGNQGEEGTAAEESKDEAPDQTVAEQVESGEAVPEATESAKEAEQGKTSDQAPVAVEDVQEPKQPKEAGEQQVGESKQQTEGAATENAEGEGPDADSEEQRPEPSGDEQPVDAVETEKVEDAEPQETTEISDESTQDKKTEADTDN